MRNHLTGFALLAELMTDLRDLSPRRRGQVAINRLDAMRAAHRTKIANARKVECELAAPNSQHFTKGKR
jgi:hypothetical protein